MEPRAAGSEIGQSQTPDCQGKSIDSFLRDVLFFFLKILFDCELSLLLHLGLPYLQRGLLFLAMPGLLIVVASLVEHRLQALRLRSCGSQVLEHGFSSCNTWALVAPQHVESSQARDCSVSPALAGRYPFTVPTAKSMDEHFKTACSKT